MTRGETFDVFLCHNSADKPTVLQLAEELVARGLRVWLDVKELIPGRPWQEALEAILQTAKSAAVLVAKDGVGPWQDREVRACLDEFVRRELPVIPVLLPEAPQKPEFPLFLRAFTWVDLREGITREGIDQLVWGITGQRPSETPRRILRVGSLETPDTLERLADTSVSGRGWQSFLESLAASAQARVLMNSQLGQLLHSICKNASRCNVRDNLQFSQLELAIDEANRLIADADSSAGCPESRKRALQATTLVVTAFAGALERSRRAQSLVITICNRVLALDEIKLCVAWPPNGPDRLYTLAVESADPHDDSVYVFLDRHCRAKAS